ncbi:tetratricopeptide repeat protein [Catalinimonas niigatensis]|uniref:tetratricopeptide repeat protein n=1 Tax=Catalinimonas niigatensis TaxID=1397264 RepID=UPI00266558AD|nr:tetratricopeptide repeat protein [Catalinimonas niigatensis]WPP50757.1 tetratricopeptide repeat protein [Catalinimonas niigatensis]
MSILTSITLAAQANSSIDSLLALLPTVQKKDQVDILNQLGEAYRYQDISQSTLFLVEALSLANKLEYKPGISVAQLNLGANAIIRGDLEAGILHTRQALQLFKILKDQTGVANAKKNLGILAYFEGDYAQAKSDYQAALKLFLQTNDTRGQAKCYANIGLVLTLQGEYEKALANFFQSLRCNEQLNNQDGIASDYVYIAQIYQHSHELVKAIDYQKKALTIFENTNNQIRQSLLLSDIGKSHHHQKSWKKALEYYENALKLQKVLGNERDIGTTLGNMGAVYEEIGQINKARKHYQASLKIARRVGNETAIPALLLNLAELELQQSAYQTAEKYLNQAFSMSKRMGHKEDLQQVFHLFYLMYEAQKNYPKALHHYQISRTYQDSLFNEEKSRQMAELQTSYEVEKKEQQITAQAQEIGLLAENRLIEERLRMVLFIALGLLFLLILFVYSRYRLKQRSAQLLNEKNQEIQQKNIRISQMNQELEKRMLRAQMDPHFIFNSLNSIQHFITTNDKTSALKYLSKFSKLIRRVLENSVNTQVPVADEITLLKHYIELERLRFDHCFDYQMYVDASVDIHDTEIPFLLIQPYVENALVHGLRYKAEGGRLMIEMKKAGNALLCVVEDNGVGRDEARRHRLQNAFPSRGMSLTQQRLETLNHKRIEKTSVCTQDLVDAQGNPSGTRVEILVPLTDDLCLVPSL